MFLVSSFLVNKKLMGVEPPNSTGWIHPSRLGHQRCCPSSGCFKHSVILLDCSRVHLKYGRRSFLRASFLQSNNLLRRQKLAELPFLCDLLFPHHFVYWGDNLDHLLQIYHPVTIHVVHPEPSCENIWQSKSSEANAGHLNAHCSFSFGLPPEVTSIANRNSLKSMKLFWSLSKVLKPKGS